MCSKSDSSYDKIIISKNAFQRLCNYYIPSTPDTKEAIRQEAEQLLSKQEAVQAVNSNNL